LGVQGSAADRAVCAVLGTPGERLDRALAAQRRPPDAYVRDSGGLRQRLERALATGAGWIWVLDGSVVPRAGALLGLLEGLDRAVGLEEPHLMTGVVVTPDGLVDEGRGLWYRRDQIDAAMAASAERLLPVRAASGSVLVRRDAVAAELPRERTPASPAAVLEWTARVLRDRTGYLTPDSESEAVAPGYDPASHPLTAARLVLGGALVRLDRIRYGYELAERLGLRSLER
jgi:hypothetical protein